MAVTAPDRERSLYPTNIAIFTAKIPGADCARAVKSKNSFLSIQRRLSTTSASIKGSMAYPPPSVNRPILKKIKNREK